MSTDLAKRAPKSELAVYLESNIGELAKSCAASITPESMLTLANIIISKTPDLQKCAPETILNSVVQAGSLGLTLSPTQGEAYLIPRWNKKTNRHECNFQPGYRGLAKLVRGADNDIEYIRPMLVYSKDEFKVVHEPVSAVYHTSFSGPGRGPITHVYSVVCYKSGRKVYEVMTTEEVEDIRKRSDGADGPFWKYNWGEMAKKTVIKRHCKQFDQTPELARAIEADNVEYAAALEAPVIPQNNSGHGRGQYANDDNVTALEKILRNFTDTLNARWLDNWTDENGNVHPAIKKDLMNVWQLDGHLKKWACETGRLDEASMDVGRKGLALYTAIVWFRSDEDQAAMKVEMNRYQKECWKRAAQAIKAKYPDDSPTTPGPAREPGDDEDEDEALDAIAREHAEAGRD